MSAAAAEGRTPIEAHGGHIEYRRDALNHVWPYFQTTIYPCRGCGLELYQVPATQACQKPYSDPVAVEAMVVRCASLLEQILAVLIQIRDSGSVL